MRKIKNKIFNNQINSKKAKLFSSKKILLKKDQYLFIPEEVIF